MTEAEILERCDLNLVEFNRDGTRFTAGGVVHHEDGLLFFAPGHRFPIGFTGVMRTNPDVPAAEVLARTQEYFAATKRGHTFVVAEHRDGDLVSALQSSGISRFGNSPGMVLDAPLPDAAMPEGVTVDRVAEAESAREYAEVSAIAYATYGMPEKVALRHFADHRFFLQPHVAAFVARIGGKAAAVAMVLVSHGVAGIYWVGTTPEARGRGLASLLTRIAGNAGFEMGARFAALQASVMGEPVYLRLGYRIVTRYPWYVVMP